MAPLQLTQADDGRAVSVAPGQQVVLRLPENPSTGFRWEPPAGVALSGDDYQPPGSPAAGAGGERVFTLAPFAAASELRFALTRPWGGGAPDRIFTLRLIAGG